MIGWDYHRGWKKVGAGFEYPACSHWIGEAWLLTQVDFCVQDQDKRAKDEAHRREIDRSFREEHEVRLIQHRDWLALEACRSCGPDVLTR